MGCIHEDSLSGECMLGGDVAPGANYEGICLCSDDPDPGFTCDMYDSDWVCDECGADLNIDDCTCDDE